MPVHSFSIAAGRNEATDEPLLPADAPDEPPALLRLGRHVQEDLVVLDGERKAKLLAWLRTCPADTLRYKGILPMRSELLEYLQRSLEVAE